MSEDGTSERLDGVLTKIMDRWRQTSPFYIDAKAVGTMEDLDPRPYALRSATLKGRNVDVEFVPVTGLRRSRYYQNAAKVATEIRGNGIALRVANCDIHHPDFEESLDGLLNRLEFEPADIDLFVRL